MSDFEQCSEEAQEQTFTPSPLEASVPDPAPVDPPDYAVYQPACEAPDPMPAFGHLGEEPLPQTANLGEEERAEIRAKPVDDMNDAEFQTALQDPDLTPAQMEQMLAATASSPERKLELWKRFHTDRNAAQLEEDLPESEVGEDPDRQADRARREEALRTTSDELALETAELPKNYTMDDVDKLIARKEKERAIEHEYGINITAQTERRADGSRVMWSDRELDDIATSLEQIPPEMFEQGRIKMHELRRQETVITDKNPDNANCSPDGTIRVADMGAAVGDLEKRGLKTADFEAAHGTESNHLERVLLHEIGHAVNHGDPETHKIHQEEWDTLPGKRLGSGEYFAEDFHHALNDPEKLYADSFKGTQDALVAARAKAAADPSPENQEALRAAEAEAIAYPKMYNNMRNTVFGTNKREDAIAESLAEQGYSTDEIDDFRAKAQKACTPDQLDELARREGLMLPEEAY